MWPYVVLITVPILVQHVRIQGATLYIVNSKKGNNKSALRCFFVILLLMLILRHKTIGIDLKNYESIFFYISKSNWRTALGRSTEIAYSAMNKIISIFGGDFFWVMAATAILSIWFLAKGFIRDSEDAGLTIVLFINLSNFLLLFSGLRQAIALSLGFLAYDLVREKKLLAFLFIVFFSMLFHTSAFMLLFMFPLYHMRISPSGLLWVVPVMLVVFVFNQQIFGVLTLILSMFTKYDAQISSTGAYTMMILYIIFAVFAYLIPDEEKMDPDTLGMRNFLLLAVVLQMFAPLHDVAMRMNYYYMIFIPLVIPRIIRRASKRWEQVAMVARMVMLVFFMAYFFLTAPSDNSLHTFPYRFFWQNMP